MALSHIQVAPFQLLQLNVALGNDGALLDMTRITKSKCEQ